MRKSVAGGCEWRSLCWKWQRASCDFPAGSQMQRVSSRSPHARAPWFQELLRQTQKSSGALHYGRPIIILYICTKDRSLIKNQQNSHFRSFDRMNTFWLASIEASAIQHRKDPGKTVLWPSEYLDSANSEYWNSANCSPGSVIQW